MGFMSADGRVKDGNQNEVFVFAALQIVRIVLVEHIDHSGRDLKTRLTIGTEQIPFPTDAVACFEVMAVLQRRLGALANHRMSHAETHAVLSGQYALSGALAPREFRDVVGRTHEHTRLLTWVLLSDWSRASAVPCPP